MAELMNMAGGLPQGLELLDEIERLKQEKNAIFLAHYYVTPDIQDLADFVGDSLDLSRRARDAQTDVILFAGVRFMAETAKILNPGRKVILPDLEAGCSLADQCPPTAFREFREAHPDHFVITYINSTAEIKALSDAICTSSNAKKIVSRVPKDQPILFAPDRNLGAYLARTMGREMTLWDGSCMVHEIFEEKKIHLLKQEHPDALVIAHPECEEVVLVGADFIGSTRELLKFVVESSAKEFIVATESGILHPMSKAAPDKLLIPAPPSNDCACNECPHMKRNTLEKVYLALRDLGPEITLPEELRQAAQVPLDRMLEWSN